MIINLTRTCISYNVKLPKGQIPLDGHGPNQTRPDQTSRVSDKVSDMFGSD